jgi:amino acid permease
MEDLSMLSSANLQEGGNDEDKTSSSATIFPLEMENNHVQEKEATDRDTNVQYLGMMPLAMLVFYNVSGGPFGIEESVRSAGFFFSIVGFLLMPLIWSVPESLVTAELASAYPEASGGVAWVEEAFGSAAGWMAGFLGWVAGATDSKFVVCTN